MTKVTKKTETKAVSTCETEKKPKTKYKVTNWSAYNKSLKNRGNITIWIEEDVLENWYDERPSERGGQYKYSDRAIEALLGLKVVFKLAYRQLEGFAESLLSLMAPELEVPSYSQISRRAKTLKVDIAAPKSDGGIHIVVDSTGLKVYGEGEWTQRKHGKSKRRRWRKLHLGVDSRTGFIHAQVLTGNGKGDGDAQQLPELLGQVKSPIDDLSGDGAYDTYDVWELLEDLGIEGLIPPQENAVYWEDENGNLLKIGRNRVLEAIGRLGEKEWKLLSGYHQRSLSETAMMRFKTIFGRLLYSKKEEQQKTEAAVKIKCLNKMTAQGMPVSVAVAA